MRPGHHHKIHFLGLFLKWHQYRISRSNFSRNSSVTIWAQLKIVDFFSNPSKNPEKNSSFSDTPVFAQQAQHSATHSPQAQTDNVLLFSCTENNTVRFSSQYSKIDQLCRICLVDAARTTQTQLEFSF